MKKRILSLLCVLMLCLGLLPVTALAAAPNGQVIYVGNENVTSGGYWTTDSNGNVTAYTGQGTPTDNYIYYDADTNTLTLHNATIKKGLDYDENITGGTSINDAAIGVFNQSGAAELTIILYGSNTIAEVGKGIYVLAISQSTGSSSLTIMGNGSLDTSSSQTGIWVQSNSNDAALSIKNAKVTATIVDSYGSDGVRVQSEGSFSASLTVDGGSLTATGSGATFAGIQLLFGSGGSVSGTPTVTASNNAIVRANGGIANNSSSPIQYKTGNDGTGGIVWNGSNGTVYGEAILQEDINIGEGESLTIGDGASLNTGSHEVIVDGGTLTGGDKIEGTVKYAPAITTESLPGGTVGTAYNQLLGATGSETITWSLASGTLPTGLKLSDDGKITGTPTAAGTSTFTVTATNNIGSDSREFTLKIEKPAFIPVTDLELNKDSLTLQENSSDTLIATVKPDDATNRGVTWESSDTSIATVSEDGTVTAISAGNATITATAADGSGISASCTLTVTHGNMVQTPKKDATCTVDGTEEYWTCEICGKHFEDERGTIPTTPEDNKIQATGHSYGEPVWNWSEDGKTCTVTFTCEKDETHKETPKVTVTSAEKTPGTCTEAGVTTYTATVEFNGKTYTDTKDLTDIPATGHSYGTPVWNWAEDGKTCTVTFICEKDETHKETPKVKITSAVKTPATCTEAGVTTYTATVEFNGKTYTDTKDLADIPATGHSYDNGKCTVCGAIASDFKVIITAGANGSWQKGTKDGLTFTSNAAYKHFQKVQVDGKDLDASNYTVKEGSTIVTLKTSYLETLSVGKHTLAIVSETGTATTEFTIKAAASANDRNPANPNGEATESVQTGDNTNMMLWIVMLFVSASILGIAVYEKRKKHMEN